MKFARMHSSVFASFQFARFSYMISKGKKGENKASQCGIFYYKFKFTDTTYR
jgi:hypothetical protein